MSLAIWKTELKIEDLQTIKFPTGSRMLSFANQREIPCVWFMVDPGLTQPAIKCRIRLIGTGHQTSMPLDQWTFLGTALFGDGALILHAFYTTVSDK